MGKNKGLIIGVVVILLLVAGYFLMNKKGSSTAPGTTSLTSEGTTESKSLKDLLTAGIAQKCTYSTTDENGSSEGTSYISGGKVRGDFTVVSSGKTTVSHMISDGKTSYIWTDGEETGFKMTVTETDTQASDPTGQAPTQGTAGWDDKFDYKCSAWVTDGSYFTPPSNVKFTDFSELFKGNLPQ